MRKFILPLVLFILLGFAAVWYFMARETTSYSENSAFQAIPVKTPLVIEVPDVNRFLAELHAKNPLVEELRTIPNFQGFFEQTADLAKLLAESEALRLLLQEQPVLMAFNPEGKNEIGCLFALSLENKAERDGFVSYFKDLQQDGKGKLSHRDYDGLPVYQFRTNGKDYVFAESKGIFLFSSNAIFVEEALRQIQTENLMTQEQFTQLYSTVSTTSSFNLFVNHKKLSILIDKLVAPDFRPVARSFANFSDWSELDVTLKASEMLMTGFSSAGPTYDNYLNVLKNQEGERFEMEQLMPASTCFFVNFNLQDFSQFQRDYEEFLKKQGSSFYNRETRLTMIERDGKKKLVPLFEEISDDDFVMAFGSVNQNEPAQNRFFVAKVKGQSLAREALLPVLETYARYSGKNFNDTKTSFQLQKDVAYDIYEFPVPDLAQVLFGQVFAGVDCNYLCFYDNYLIFADNASALKNYVHDLVLSSTLEKDVHFKKFQEQMASRSSIYSYINLSRAFGLSKHYLNEETNLVLDQNEAAFRKFYGLGWQISGSSGSYLNNLYLRFDPVRKDDPQTVWQSKLDSTITLKPLLVDNHNDKQNKEVLVLDNKNNLYLINKEGVGLWKIKLSGPIIGDIYQVDYYRNGKLQYLFNTKTQLYLVDRNGNNTAKFPVNFRSPATNGVAVVDYDNNRNYRFFVALENRQIAAYDRDGKLVTGFAFNKSDSEVTNTIKYFRIDGKDYLVAADRYKTYILDRQGNIRVKTSDNFEHSGNEVYLAKAGQFALATTDTKGLVHLQYFDGKSSTLDLGKVGAGHWFVADDLNGDGQTDFVIADSNLLTAYTDKGKKLMSYQFGNAVSSRPNIYTFANNAKKIGVLCRDESRVYLLNMNGKLYDGFPLQGNTDFSIGYLSKGNSYFNLLVGNEDNSFFNYKVE